MDPVNRPVPNRARRRILRLFLDHVSFATPRAQVLNFTGILLLLAAWPTSKLSLLPVRSVWENAFGFKPYSSGMMRALSRLLHGDFTGAWEYNPLAYAVLPLLLTLIAWNARRWWNESRARPGPRSPVAGSRA